MAKTPSNRRREGRNAFDPQCTDEDRDMVNPYKSSTSWYARSHAENWNDGWKEAEAKWKEEQKEQEDKTICPLCGKEI